MDPFPTRGVPDAGGTAWMPALGLAFLSAGMVRAGLGCAPAFGAKFKLGFDYSLDALGVHMVAGLIGTLLVGLMATSPAPAAIKGLFCGSGLDRLRRQAVGAFTVPAYSAVVTAILSLIVKHTTGLRLSEKAEVSGIEKAEHGEIGYYFAVAAGTTVHARRGAEE